MKLSKAEFQAVLEAAQPLTVPLNKLFLAQEYQSRDEVDDADIEALADSILANGLLQNLLVVAAPRGKYGVCAGGRRLRALNRLAQRGDIAENHPVTVREVAKEHALMVSLAENVFRVSLSVCEEFQGFKRLIEQGRSVEEVAAAFGVTPLVVKRRMKLAQVSPLLLEEFKQGRMKLDCLMVLAGVEDHQRQESAWAGVPSWGRHPEHLRRLLTQHEVCAATDSVAQFVTLEAYEQAGGPTRRDLFSDENDVYLLDEALLEKLALDKLQATVVQVAAEGWGWTDVRVRFASHEYQSHGRLRPVSREPLEHEAEQLQALHAQLEQVRLAVQGTQDDDEEPDDVVTQQLFDQQEALAQQIRDIREGLEDWPEAFKPWAGCVIHVGHGGQVMVRRGLIRPDDKAEIKRLVEKPTEATCPQNPVNPLESLPATSSRPTHSERLVRSMTAHQVAALQAELIAQPKVAMALLVQHMAAQLGWDRSDKLPFGITVRDSHADLAREGSDLSDSPAWLAVERERHAWAQATEGKDLLPWLLAQEDDTLARWLAVLVALTIEGVASSEAPRPAVERLASAVSLDMRAWWRPTAATYLQHVSKARILEVTQEAVGAPALAGLNLLKKAELISRVESFVAQAGWLPEVLRPARESHEPAPDVPYGLATELVQELDPEDAGT